MIKLENLTKTFGPKIAVNHINLEVKAGEIFGFLGPNGAGKTTTIKMLVGLIRPDEGKAILDGFQVEQEPLEAKKRLSYVPDNPDIYQKMTQRQYYEFLGAIYRVPKDVLVERAETLAEAFGIQGDMDSVIGDFSHGMQQKTCLIGALLHDPEVLILDEPMVGLDPKSAFTLKNLMRERCDRGKTVFFSTHVMEVAEKLCDRLAIIHHGRIIAVGTMEDLRRQMGEDGTLEELFLELTEEKHV